MKGIALTAEQRDTLVDAYLQQGFDAARSMAIEYGISPRRIAKILRERGIPNTTKRGAKPGRKPAERDDARWARAIAIGPVIA